MAFGSGLDDDDAVVSDINVTPLVDVMLVLLVIFILTVPVLTHGVKVDLPRATDKPQVIKPKTIEISVTADGTLHWDRQTVDARQLDALLEAAAARAPQPEIYIRGDRKAAYEPVVQVMAAAQRAGIRKLGFVTEPNR
ncbi:MAG: Biopolymer transport protein ExbD/TolR [Burkholderiaceae bacterium]|jgi:biopolymer transport protein ExbD|nr:MAG: Biopolymer transport protein ExbD/TolR [Burkholderiaceae bacterium]